MREEGKNEAKLGKVLVIYALSQDKDNILHANQCEKIGIKDLVE